jgi:hypothetical protein
VLFRSSPDLRQETIQQLATQRQTFQKASARLRKKIDDLAGTELLILQEFATLETRVELQVAMNASKLRADNIAAMLLQQKEEKEEQEETKAQQQKQWKQSVERRVAADRSDETCAICLVPDSERSPFWIDENVTLYPGCGHMYHSECLNDWIQTNFQTTCPMCRAKITQKDINQVKHMLSIVQQRRKLQKEQRLKEKEIAKREKIQQQKIEKAALQKREDIKRQKNFFFHLLCYRNY